MKRNVRRVRRLESSQPSQAQPVRSKSSVGHRAHRWLYYLSRYLPMVIVIGVVAYILMFSGLFQIKNVEVEGPGSNLSAQLSAATTAYLKSGWLNQNWLFVDTRGLSDELKKQFSQSEKIIVEKQFPNKLVIKTDEQTPALVWQSGGKYYLLSVSGRVITEQGSGDNQQLLRVSDANNIPVQTGQYVVSKDFIDFTKAVSQYAESNKLSPVSFSVAETTTELMAKVAPGYFIKFDTSQSVDSQLRALTALEAYLATNKKKPAEYIDLRVPGKTFYK